MHAYGRCGCHLLIAMYYYDFMRLGWCTNGDFFCNTCHQESKGERCLVECKGRQMWVNRHIQPGGASVRPLPGTQDAAA